MTLLINADHAREKPCVGERGHEEDFREEGWETGQGPGITSQNTFLSCEREYKYINYFPFYA
jgi:hypothetical protein